MCLWCYCTPFGATRRLTDYPLRGADHPRDIGQESGCGHLFVVEFSFTRQSRHQQQFYQLRRIKCSIKALPFDTAKSLVNSFVISRIDYCNSLLTGLPNYAPDRLQRVMNAAATMLCGAGKYSHVTGLIRDRLHWLPVAVHPV